MKLIHLSDLHLGTRLNEFSMLEDQEYILKKILRVIDEEQPDGVILAGDIYDKPVPPAEAVQLFDEFLVGLARRRLHVFVISGNHDSPERIAFASRILEAGGIYMSPVYDGHIAPVTLKDAYGDVDIYLLPFLKPAHVRRFHEGAEISTYTDAVACAIADMKIDPGRRNVLVTHQFVVGAVRSESEDLSVGGADAVDASVFRDFDYVALGHIHSPQNCGSERIRYCGTPLKYSFSEASDCKSVTVAELHEKGTLCVRTVALTPRKDMKELRGSYEELTRRSFYENTTWQEDYIHITLTDEEDVPEAIGKLRVIYHNLMKLDYDNTRTRTGVQIRGTEDMPKRTPLQLFSEFYELQNNRPMTEEQTAFVRNLIEKTWGDER